MANNKKTKPKKTATAAAKKKATAKKVAPKKGNTLAKKKVEIIKKALSSPSTKSKPASTKKVSGSKVATSLNPLGKNGPVILVLPNFTISTKKKRSVLNVERIKINVQLHVLVLFVLESSKKRS